MIAGAVALAAGYNTFATVKNWTFGSAPANPPPELPHLPGDLMSPVILVGIGATIAFVVLGSEDLANAARENPYRQFKPLNLDRHS